MSTELTLFSGWMLSELQVKRSVCSFNMYDIKQWRWKWEWSFDLCKAHIKPSRFKQKLPNHTKKGTTFMFSLHSYKFLPFFFFSHECQIVRSSKIWVIKITGNWYINPKKEHQTDTSISAATSITKIYKRNMSILTSRQHLRNWTRSQKSSATSQD